jgi:hypothetical protein
MEMKKMRFSIKAIRNIALALLLVAATIGVQKKVFATSCSSAYFTGGGVQMTYCGPYIYESSEAINDMGVTAEGICGSYLPNTHASLYWWQRVTGDDQDAYYDSGWMCQ